MKIKKIMSIILILMLLFSNLHVVTAYTTYIRKTPDESDTELYYEYDENYNLIGVFAYVKDVNGEYVYIPGLQNAEEIRGRKQFFTKTEIENITELTFEYMYEDLEGFDALTNLEKLTINTVQFWNSESNFDVLSQLTNLTTLTINDSNFSDLSILKNLPNLTYLDISGSVVEDISALTSFPNLQTLNISNNIIDLEKNATIINQLKSKIPNFTYDSQDELIYVPDTHLRSKVDYALRGREDKLIRKSKMENLTWLEIGYCTNLTGLEYASSIRSLEIGDSPTIGDWTVIKNLKTLEYLLVADSNFKSIDIVIELPKLTRLDLCGNGITDLTGIEKLNNLETLCLGNNKITDITLLKKLTKLKHLHLDNNRITNIYPLAELTELWFLNLSSNNLKDITPLQTLTKLNWLDISNNYVDLEGSVSSSVIGVLKGNILGYFKYTPQRESNSTEIEIDNDIEIEEEAEGTYLSNIDIKNNSVDDLLSKITTSLPTIEIYNDKGTLITGKTKVGTGSVIKVKDAGGAIVQEYIVIIYGDVTGTGEIGGSDAYTVLQFVAGVTTPSPAQEKAGRVNKGSSLGAADGYTILQYVAGLRTSF